MYTVCMWLVLLALGLTFMIEQIIPKCASNHTFCHVQSLAMLMSILEVKLQQAHVFAGPTFFLFSLQCGLTTVVDIRGPTGNEVGVVT